MAEQVQSFTGSGNLAYPRIIQGFNDSGTGPYLVTSAGATGSINTGQLAVANYIFNNGSWLPEGAAGAATAVNAYVQSGGWGMMSGTTVWAPLMVESGVATSPQRLVTTASVTVDRVYIGSGAIIGTIGTGTNFIGFVSGNTTTSVSSVFVASGNIYIQSGGVIGTLGTGTNFIGVVSGNQSILGSVAITSSATLPVSGNSLGIYGATGSPSLTFYATRVGAAVTGDTSRNLTTDTFVVSGNSWIGVGSVLVTGSVNLGGTGVITGSVAVTNTVTIGQPVSLGTGTNFIGNISGNIINTGSVAVTSYTVGSQTLIDRSGVMIYFDGGTIPNWRAVGSAYITSGSVTSTINTLPIGSIYGIGIGSVYAQVAGSVAITTSLLSVSGPTQLYGMGTGTTTFVPIMTLSGAVAVPQPVVNFGGALGSPSFKQATVTASGLYSQVWTLANTGSLLEIHGYQISRQAAGFIRLIGSGSPTPVVMSQYWMPGSSVIEKTFVQPITPWGAGIHGGVGVGTAGSTEITIYGRIITP